MTDRMNPTDQATQLTQEARDEAVYRALLVVMGDTPRAAAPHEFIRLLEQDGYTVAARRAIEGSGVVEALELAWGIIANAGGGDWTRESAEWQDAAARWRDRYHTILAALPRPEGPRDDVTGRCDGCHHAPHAGRCEGSTGWGRCACATALPRPEEPRVERCAAGVHAVHAGIPTVVTCGEARDSETHEQGAPDFDHLFTPEAR